MEIMNIQETYPLHNAVNSKDYRLLRKLAQQSVDLVNAKDGAGLTALHVAARLGEQRALRILLVVGKADINCTEQDGKTALHYAALGSHFKCVNFMLKRGVNTTAKDSFDKTASEYLTLVDTNGKRCQRAFNRAMGISNVKRGREDKKERQAKRPRIDQEERKRLREENNLKRKQERNSSFVDLENMDWKDIAQIQVDGNNLLYLTNLLRQFTLKGKKKRAEMILALVTKEFAAVKEIDSTIIFDDTKLDLLDELNNGFRFKLVCARPTYATSDDQLVAWAQIDPEAAKRTLVVTSDRELCDRLQACGCKLAKPKAWVTYAANTLSKNEQQSLDEWLEMMSNTI